MAHIQYVDTLIREYLIYRGFATSLKAFDSDLKSDKDKSFRVDKIIEHISHSINTHDLNSLRDMWNHLDNHLFSKLEQAFVAAVKKLESSLLKLYLVTAYTSGKQEKVNEFFVKMSNELHSHSEWKEWFYFPFCKNPEENASFAVCFSKQWQDTLMLSLHNFLATIFQCMPQPTLSRIDVETLQMRKLQEENQILRTRLQSLQEHNAVPPQSGTSSHQSRHASYQRQRMQTNPNPQSLNDIIPTNVPPPAHIIDDFYSIAQESLSIGNAADTQVRGLRSLIRNIGSSGSPVMGRKESLDRSKKRSESAGSRSWNFN